MRDVKKREAVPLNFITNIKTITAGLMLHTDFKITLLIYRLAGKPASHAAGVTYRYKEIQLRFIFRARIVFIFVSCLRNLCVTSKKEKLLHCELIKTKMLIYRVIYKSIL